MRPENTGVVRSAGPAGLGDGGRGYVSDAAPPIHGQPIARRVFQGEKQGVLIIIKIFNYSRLHVDAISPALACGRRVSVTVFWIGGRI